MYDFDAYEAVDELIDEINAGYYSESTEDDDYVTGEEVYEAIHEVLTEQVEAGEITLEFANEVNDMAYKKYVVESAQGIAGAAAALLGVVVTTAKVVNHFRSKKGYKNDPELKTIRDEVKILKSEVASTRDRMFLTMHSLSTEVEKYNKMANEYACPTIKLNDTNTSAKEIKEEIKHATDEAANVIRQKQSTKTNNATREGINPQYNPEKAMELREKAQKIDGLADQYGKAWAELVSEVARLNALRKKLNKIARKKVHSEEDKAAITKGLQEIDADYKEALQYIDRLK